MKVIEFQEKYFEQTCKLLADFRVTLRAFKNIKSEPDIDSARQELKWAIDDKWPIYLVEENNNIVGYMLLRIDDCVWVEHIYVTPSFRRKGVASLLYNKAEDVSKSIGGDTVYNFVHPNNDGMMSFLRSKGYTVLNLVEVRKPYKDEMLNKKYKIGNNEFDY